MIRPNFLIVGAAKSGTTSLYHYLRQHPDIFMPEWKELSLFIGDPFGPLHRVKKPLYYQKAFSKVRDQNAVGEASTAYLFDEAAPKIIKAQLGKIRIIIILRDPVAMSYSLYNHQLRKEGETIENFQEALDHFLSARIPDEEGGSSRAENRNLQINYYIGLAYEAIGDKKTSEKYYTLSSDQDSRAVNYMHYYRGLSFLKLGNIQKANEIFNSLITEGTKQIEQDSEQNTDFFAKFGEEEAANRRLSQAYLLKGVGYKGLGEKKLARDNLQKAVELSVSNLWANSELSEL